MASSYQDLDVWKKAMAACVACYQVTRGFPREEQYGLSAQLRRAAVSVPLNISEGNYRSGTKEYCRFLSIARGSAAEVRTCLQLASALGYLDPGQTLEQEYDQISRMLYAMIKKLTP
jgi:four helix bundle protein